MISIIFCFQFFENSVFKVDNIIFIDYGCNTNQTKDFVMYRDLDFGKVVSFECVYKEEKTFNIDNYYFDVRIYVLFSKNYSIIRKQVVTDSENWNYDILPANHIECDRSEIFLENLLKSELIRKAIQSFDDLSEMSKRILHYSLESHKSTEYRDNDLAIVIKYNNDLVTIVE